MRHINNIFTNVFVLSGVIMGIFVAPYFYSQHQLTHADVPELTAPPAGDSANARDEADSQDIGVTHITYISPVRIVPPEETRPIKVQIINYITKVFGNDASEGLAIARCESGFNPNAKNDNYTKDGKVWSTDFGVFQINDYFHSNKGDIPNLTWKQNVDLAKKIYDASGRGAWACVKSGAYLQFLDNNGNYKD